MKQTSPRHEQLILQLITLAVIGNGLLIIAGTLLAQLRLRGFHALNDTIVSLPLLSGLTLLYIGTLLHRRKRAAWAVAVPVYTFILFFNILQYDDFMALHRHPLAYFLRSILIPVAVVAALIYFRQVFTVKSAIQNFSISVRVIVIMLAVILAYGTAGYVLLDQHDFRQEISFSQAVHHTVDQFDFTNDQTLVPHTRRAAVFVDTLSILSAAAVAYIIVSLFGPIKAKLTNQNHNRHEAANLLTHHSGDSEDFFKIWPHDKSYYGNHGHTALLAYRIQRGVGLVVGEPIGRTAEKPEVIRGFNELCRLNDWLPAYIHLPEEALPIYEQAGFQSQKIGEEAVVTIESFLKSTVRNKYFRQIRNKFEKQGYTWELLTPPHSEAVLTRLHEVSDDWLSLPGRQERGFMMGYFSGDYMQQGNVVVARDSAGTIQAFLNQVPTYQKQEANYDLLRHTKKALGNVNDYVLMAFIDTAQTQGYKTINLGLCPLAGLSKETSEEKSMIDSTMRFVYANGNRFYSFTGLYRFKSKYEPEWRSRYIAYKGGVRGFTRTIYSLNKAMNRTK
jgi:phosphatidylglycerol lysyltransferase